MSSEKQRKLHTFHIPVMGTGFSIDSPLKVAKYGISSVISLVDDNLIEAMRKFYCEKFGEEYTPITQKDKDKRARRITAYLNLMDRQVKRQFKKLRESAFEVGSEIHEYFELLPETSPVKALYKTMMKTPEGNEKQGMQEQLRQEMRPGSIDVNIMTKIDNQNYDENGQPLASEFSDALAALRGYAQSTVRSAIVFSAGLNQRLYTYAAQFKDFYADATGEMKKKIVIKVSDFRSSITQGKIFAKKGLWVSEYRVESGLNCGGHAFSSAGHVLGPILAEFKEKKDEFVKKLHDIYQSACHEKGLPVAEGPLPVEITAQGGIGTAEEDRFLREYYDVDGTGWGSPFLLCPQATTLDDYTVQKLIEAGPDELYLSPSSPMDVPFNNMRTSSSEVTKRKRCEDGIPGSPCVNGFLAVNNEFGEILCQASRKFQTKKLAQIDASSAPEEEKEKQRCYVKEKACICYELGNGTLEKHGIIQKESRPVSVCPGPNTAYFKKQVTLKEMIDHIYGRTNLCVTEGRPNLFIQELRMNIDYLKELIQEALPEMNKRKQKFFEEFKQNLMDATVYYQELFAEVADRAHDMCLGALSDVDRLEQELATVTIPACVVS